jgi:hypothetical protein
MLLLVRSEGEAGGREDTFLAALEQRSRAKHGCQANREGGSQQAELAEVRRAQARLTLSSLRIVPIASATA